VGLDPEETVDQYLQQLEEGLPVALVEPQAPHLSREPVEPEPHTRAGRTSPTPLKIQIDLKRLPGPALAAAAVVLLVAAIALVAWRGGTDRAEVANAEMAQQDATPPADQAPANDATHAANVATEGLRIELKTTGPCWVSATADRSPVLARLLQAGESETIEAKDELVLRVGDPSTITVTINGELVRPLGRAGLPVTVQITRQNYKDFIAG
jgi:hypothetical protein